MATGFPRTWLCSGCGKMHPLSRDIEGDDFGRYWCRHSILKGIDARRNDLPPQAYDKRGNVRRDLFA